MREAAFLTVAAALGSCAAGPEPGTRTVAAEQAYQSLVAGKVAAAPLTCLPSFERFDLHVIDGRTVAYTLGRRTTYVVQLSQGCGALDATNYTLVTKQLGGSGPCRGDSAEVVDLASRTNAGFCMIQQIVPYGTPG